MATEKGNIKIVKLLESKGAELDIQDCNFIFIFLIRSSILVFVFSIFLSRRHFIMHAITTTYTLLNIFLIKVATLIQQTKKYYYIIMKFNRNTLLHSACSIGNLPLVKYLVEKGICINLENKSNETPLFVACKKNKKVIIEYLVDKGADLTKENKNCLQVYCSNTMISLDIVNLLIKKCPSLVDPNVNILQIACKMNNYHLLKLSLEKGVDINTVNEEISH